MPQQSLTVDPILMHEIQQDEGREACVYKDSLGWWTIGDGILVDRRVAGAGLRPEEMDFITANRVNLALAEVPKILSANAWEKMNPVRRRVVANMAYNLGIPKLAKFHDMLSHIESGRYDLAAIAMKDSAWFSQVGARGERLFNQMRTGMDQ